MTTTIPTQTWTTPKVAPPEAVATLRAALQDLIPPGPNGDPVLVSASVWVETHDPLAWFAVASTLGDDAGYWFQPATGRALVGSGVATSLTVAGADRFRTVARTWARWCATAVSGGPAAGRAGAGPVLLGGATFLETPSTDACWVGFEDGRLDVPAILLSTVGGDTVLTAQLMVEGPLDASAAIDALLDRAACLLGDGSSRTSAHVEERLPTLRRAGSTPERVEWSASVARSSGAVGRGRIDKVVLARRVDVEASAPLDVRGALSRLGASPDGAATAPVTVFAFTRGERTFLGASPERLVASSGRVFHTIALAGTTARDPDPVADEHLALSLLASEKDREEHAVVVDMLRETLAPVAATLDIERTPHVVRLPTVQHLASDVSGVLHDDRSVLDLVDRLHPTPAVGGWPRAVALELLEEQEHLDRGWYAGPVGWLDSHGDGEFVVAIRSGVVQGTQASLFVGCGIVGDSEPDREWAESDMKLESLASALGRLDP